MRDTTHVVAIQCGQDKIDDRDRHDIDVELSADCSFPSGIDINGCSGTDSVIFSRGLVADDGLFGHLVHIRVHCYSVYMMIEVLWIEDVESHFSLAMARL
jgi:hypothetical protein